MLSNYIQRFIKYNEKLIEQGELFRLLCRCHRDARSELSTVWAECGLEDESRSKPKAITDGEAFRDILDDIMSNKIGIKTASRSYLTGPGMTHTYQYVEFLNGSGDAFEIEQKVCDELDKLDVWYDYVEVKDHLAFDYKTDKSYKTNKLVVKMHA